MLFLPQKARAVAASMICAAMLLATPDNALAKGEKNNKSRPVAVFDIDTRKKTKKQISAALSASYYASLRFLGEQNIRRDDNNRDYLTQLIAYLGIVGRAEISDTVTAFFHAEITREERRTDTVSFGRIDEPQIKEALLSFRLGADTQVAVGRLRFKDQNRWVADASVDGFHVSHKMQDTVLELGVVSGIKDIKSNYLITHLARRGLRDSFGLFAIGERDGADNTLHLSGYYTASPSDLWSYQVNAGAVFGKGANGKDAGVGFDLRAIQKLHTGRNAPQLTYGFAAGSSGFRQTGLHSNKTYDGGQAQFHRYGYVYQPELSNMAVATLAYGWRPSRKFSADLTLHAYSQITASKTRPDARISGATTGQSPFLGVELSLVGAWRPNKRSKLEFGVSRFFPGPAYVDQTAADRTYCKYSFYF